MGIVPSLGPPMKSFARAALYVFFVVAVPYGILACWATAPSDAISDDAGISADAGPTSDVFSPTHDSSATTDANAVDSSDANIDTAAPVYPYASTLIAAGIGFGCHIDGSGNVWCCGNNEYGQAGGTPSGTPVLHPQQVAGVTGATALALGDYHACAVTSSQAVYCWGLNDAYQLGHASATMGDVICPGTSGGQTLTCNGTPTAVSIPGSVSIAAAGAWTCAVGVDTTVQCWGAVQAVTATGSIACGLGTAATGGNCYPAPYAVTGVTGVAQLAVAFDHACAVSSSGAVSCWGYNGEGQVSPQACPGSTCATPILVAGLGAVSSVAVGDNFTCALLADAGASCFGDNAYGELGHAPGTSGDPSPDSGGAVFNATPTMVAGLGTASELVAGGGEAACAIVSGGAVDCWGQVSVASAPGTPTAVAGLPAMNALGVPDDTYACGVATDGSVWCWYLTDGGAPAQVQ